MKSIHLVNHEKGSIHLVDGEKGGIGKSTFCRLLIEYLQDEVKIDPVNMEIIDADKDQPLVGRTYAPHHYLKEEIFDNDNSSGVSNFNDVAKQIALIYFTDNEKLLSQTDVILELASKKNVIVNLPAAVFSLVNRWMQDGGMLNLADELNIPIYKWFVTDGCQETIDTLKKSYFLYEDKIHHIIVKNKGIASTERDWWAFDGDEDLKMYFELYQETTSTIEMAQLLVGTSNYEAFKKRNLPIRDVANLQKAKELGFLMTQAGRFRQWRNLSFESLNTLSWEQLSDEFSTKNQDNFVDLAVAE